ncbi:GntR family transcriptional regulator [Lysinibacillus fusiformis]|uniref:GntR family transcriptional regulator n=1 Tax=Lysinibacillus fusiformis TaxID=28031 RepID=UPI003CFC8261
MPASEARWERVMRELRERIAAGEFDPDGRLPSTQALADQFEVSKPTVRQAITVMTALGELRGEQGVGVFAVKKE